MAETGSAAQKPSPLPQDGFGSLEFWKSQITGAEEKIKRYSSAWKKNIQRQIGQPLDLIPVTDTVVIPIDHANIEQKKAQLYFKNPDVQLLAAPGHDASADALQAFSAVLNEYLGPDGVDAEAMMDELLSDVLCPSGIGFSVLGLDVTQDGTKPVQVGERPANPDEMPPGAILGLSAPMVPVMENAPNIIHQSYFWSRISPLYGLLPARFHGSNFDRAPWLGYKFEMDTALAIRAFGLTEAEAANAGDEPDRLNEDEKQGTRDTDVVYGYCISYKGSLYNPAVKHPEEIWRLILVKGVDRVITHDRPYQKYAPDGTLMGLMGHFIGVYTPRYVSDTAIPPSDVSMSRQQVGELQRGRSQMIQQRDRSRPMRQININMMDPGQAEKIKRGEWQDQILTTTSEPIAQEIARATFPRENFDFNRIIKADINEAWALSNTSRGQEEEGGKKTATELSLRSQGSDTRMEKERSHQLKWFLKMTEKLAGLIRLFEDDRTIVQIAGDANAQKIIQWNKDELPIRFQCRAELDTMLRTDTARDFKNDLDFYQMTANDPHINRVELLTSMARKRGYDVTKIIAPQLPEKGPEPPKFGLSLKGEDMNPSMPQFPILQEMLTQLGVKIDPANVQLGLALAQKAQMMGGSVDPSQAGKGPVSGEPDKDDAHGGPAEQVEPLSKRSGDMTGKMDGMGMAPAVN